jgi:hypothetical protein
MPGVRGEEAHLSGEARTPSLLTLLGLAAAYVFALRLEFEIGTGSAIPTQLVLVPMLFLLPVGAVPLVVGACLVAGYVLDAQDGIHLDRVLLRLVNACHAIGPALVLGLAGESAPSWDDAWLYALALVAQWSFDFAACDARLTRPGRLAAVAAEVLEERPPGRRGAGAGRLLVAFAAVSMQYTGSHGGGYADGLAGETIPLVARIVCACDAFSAMTTTRSYRAARPVHEALEELQRCRPAVRRARDRGAGRSRPPRIGSARRPK